MKIQRCAIQARKKIGDVNFSKVSDYISSKGFRILYIGTSEGNCAIKTYMLDEYVSKKAFTYFGEPKTVFLHKNANEEDNLYLLLHELGHIELGHLCRSHDHDNICTERQAEVFAYFMQHPPKSRIVPALVTGVASAAVFAFLHFAVPWCTDAHIDKSSTAVPYEDNVSNIDIISDSNENYVFVTPNGEKYHKDTCRFTSRTASKIPLEDAKKEYTPCSVCKPE